MTGLAIGEVIWVERAGITGPTRTRQDYDYLRIVGETETYWIAQHGRREHHLPKERAGLEYLISDAQVESDIWLKNNRHRLSVAEQMGDIETAEYVRYLLRPPALPLPPKKET